MGVMGFPAVKIPEPLRRILRYVKSWTIKQSRCQFWDVFYKIIRIEVGGCQNPVMVGTKNNAFLWREPYQSSLCTATLFRQDPNHKSPKSNKQSQDHFAKILETCLVFSCFFLGYQSLRQHISQDFLGRSMIRFFCWIPWGWDHGLPSLTI